VEELDKKITSLESENTELEDENVDLEIRIARLDGVNEELEELEQYTYRGQGHCENFNRSIGQHLISNMPDGLTCIKECRALGYY
jgi:hypothetical protein